MRTDGRRLAQLDCIFKTWGYVPKRRVCLQCEPLKTIFKSFKYDEKRISRAVNLILRTYAALEADDILRDEKNGIRGASARLVKKLSTLRLPKELNYIVQKADRSIRALESSDMGEHDYIKHLSAIGGTVFQASLGDKKAFSIGEALSAVMIIQDMTKDYPKDKEKNRFNPLERNRRAETVTGRASAFQFLPADVRLQVQRGLRVRMYETQVGSMSAGCAETINTCFGVCLGVCSALLLYRCCCGQG